MSREGKLAKNTFILSIGTFLPKFASFITLPILTGYLTKEEYGTLDLITVLVSLLLPAVTLQIQSAAFRFLIDKRSDEKSCVQIISNILAFVISTSLIALLILFFLLPGSMGLKVLICAYFFADILVNCIRQVARGLEKNLDYSISAIISSIGKMLFAIIFVWWLDQGLIGAVTSLFLASFFSLVTLSFRISVFRYVDFRLVQWKEIKNLIDYSWPLVPNSMSLWIMRFSDRFVILMVIDVAANAVYAVANKIPALVTIAQSTFSLAWQENASIVSNDKDASEYYGKMFRAMFNLMAGIFGLLIAFTPLLFMILIRGDYEEAYCHVPILLLAMFFSCEASFFGGIYIAYKKTKSIGVTTIIGACVNLIVNLSLIHFIGLYAASGSTLVAYLFLFLYRMIDVRKVIKFTIPYKYVLGIILIMVFLCISCFMQNPVLNCVNAVAGIALFLLLNRTLLMKLLKKYQETLHHE